MSIKCLCTKTLESKTHKHHIKEIKIFQKYFGSVFEISSKTHSSAIPKRYSFICRARKKCVGVREELYAVDTVSMATHCEATPQAVQIPQFTGVVHRTGRHKVTTSVPGTAPDWNRHIHVNVK